MNLQKKSIMCELLEKGVRKNTMLRCKKYRNMHISSYFERKKMSNVKKIKSIILTAWSLSSSLPSLWMRVSLRPSPSGTWVPSLDSWFWFWKHKLQLIMYRNCKMCGRQIAKKTVRVLHLILDYHQRSESSIVRGSGGVRWRNKVTKNGAWEEKKK